MVADGDGSSDSATLRLPNATARDNMDKIFILTRSFALKIASSMRMDICADATSEAEREESVDIYYIVLRSVQKGLLSPAKY